MSNLPVLWVQPVVPPSPEDRPPRRRRSPKVLLIAAGLVLTPLLAAVVFGESQMVAPEQKPAAPITSGGSQPYLLGQNGGSEAPAVVEPTTGPRPPASAAPSTPSASSPEAASPSSVPAPKTADAPIPKAAAKPATAETTPKVSAPAAEPATRTAAPTEAPADPVAPGTGASGQPVRVIDMERRTPSATAPMPPASAKPVASKPATAPTSPVAAKVPAPASSAPDLRQGTEEGTPITAGSSASIGGSGVTEGSTPKPTPPVQARKTPAPSEKKAVVRREPQRAAPPADSEDFADRIQTLRRSEARRFEAPPPPAVEDDEEEVVVVPHRRGWDFVPPFFGSDEPRGPVLRAFEPPPRVVSRAPQGENCHYHAYPADDMPFHRDVRCHWHDDPDGPGIRYVR